MFGLNQGRKLGRGDAARDGALRLQFFFHGRAGQRLAHLLLEGRVLPLLSLYLEGEFLNDLVSLDELLLEAADVGCAVNLHCVELLLEVMHHTALLIDLHLQLVVGLQEGLPVDGFAQPGN